eukprot:6204385-Pleurochrysis_carterae.AAC.1
MARLACWWILTTVKPASPNCNKEICRSYLPGTFIVKQGGIGTCKRRFFIAIRARARIADGKFIGQLRAAPVDLKDRHRRAIGREAHQQLALLLRARMISGIITATCTFM